MSYVHRLSINNNRDAPTDQQWETAMSLWLIAGTSTDLPYPCRCFEAFNRRCGYLCPCRGRGDDLGSLPRNCCALRGQR